KVSTTAALTPIAVVLPSRRYGGTSDRLRQRKPMAVVTAVSAIGLKLWAMAVCTACWRVAPIARRFRKLAVICTVLATATAMMITDEVDEGAVIGQPSQPVTPRLTAVAENISTPMLNAAETLRRISARSEERRVGEEGGRRRRAR